MLNFHFKSRFSVGPTKFPIYFAHDCTISNKIDLQKLKEYQQVSQG